MMQETMDIFVRVKSHFSITNVSQFGHSQHLTTEMIYLLRKSLFQQPVRRLEQKCMKCHSILAILINDYNSFFNFFDHYWLDSLRWLILLDIAGNTLAIQVNRQHADLLEKKLSIGALNWAITHKPFYHSLVLLLTFH